jgi:hypothetical protein
VTDSEQSESNETETNMVNRYAGGCGKCGAPVAARAGVVENIGGAFVPFHLTCRDGGSVIVTTEFHSEHGEPIVRTRNARGTCEDAPCCGCCT